MPKPQKPSPQFSGSKDPEMSLTALKQGQTLPLVIQPRDNPVNLSQWAQRNRDLIEQKLLIHGGILFRGFASSSPAEFQDLISTLSGEPLPYLERSSPRHQILGNIYTSTEQPPSQRIFLHNENSYQDVWPMKIFFLCLQPAEKGGETPIADTRRVYRHINKDLRDELQHKGFLIVRNFSPEMGLSWETVYQTKNRAKVEAFCQERGIRTQWKQDGTLRTYTIRRFPMMHHPVTGERTWFNHGTFFHVTTLEPSLRDVLLDCMAQEDLPANTYYGDGSPIADQDLDHLRACYLREKVCFPWKKGDVLMLDNMLTAHGREPYTGPRKIAVGMAQPMSRPKSQN